MRYDLATNKIILFYRIQSHIFLKKTGDTQFSKGLNTFTMLIFNALATSAYHFSQVSLFYSKPIQSSGASSIGNRK